VRQKHLLVLHAEPSFELFGRGKILAMTTGRLFCRIEIAETMGYVTLSQKSELSVTTAMISQFAPTRQSAFSSRLPGGNPGLRAEVPLGQYSRLRKPTNWILTFEAKPYLARALSLKRSADQSENIGPVCREKKVENRGSKDLGSPVITFQL
jgi:hypothetical protein